MSTFAILKVDRARAQSVEPLGSKPKFWFSDGERRLLFKADDRGTGEDWAEVVACHLAGRLGLPHVEYDLAGEYQGDQYLRPGVVCENMVDAKGILVLGNQLLMVVDGDYPTAQRFKVRQHTVEAVSGIVAQLAPPPSSSMAGMPAGVESALDVFAGYVMLDAWIANQDRHHENWGAIWDGERLRLAPTFDHGAALARNLRDEEREERLTTKDRNRSIEAFAAKGRGAFYRSAADPRPLPLVDTFLAFAAKAPTGAGSWLTRLCTVNQDEIRTILERVPSERMSEVCRRFTLELLHTNQKRLIG